MPRALNSKGSRSLWACHAHVYISVWYTCPRNRIFIYIYIRMCVCVYTYIQYNIQYKMDVSLYICAYIYIYIWPYVISRDNMRNNCANIMIIVPYKYNGTRTRAHACRSPIKVYKWEGKLDSHIIRTFNMYIYIIRHTQRWAMKKIISNGKHGPRCLVII